MRVSRITQSVRSASTTVLILLLSADAVFIFVHFLHLWSPFAESELYSIFHDDSYSEKYEYIKTFWIVLLLLGTAMLTSSRIHFVWSLLFVYLGLDNAFQLHERGGSLVAKQGDLHAFLGLRAQDFGELTVYFTTFIVFATALAIFYVRSDGNARRASTDLLVLVGGLVFFGVFVDMLDVALAGRWWSPFIDTLEDGGELVVLSLILGYAFRLYQAGGQVDRTLLAATLSRPPDATFGGVMRRLPGSET